MISCIKETIDIALNVNNGIAIAKINPKAIIIEEEIRINHLVIGSNSISKNTNYKYSFSFISLFA